MTPGEPLTHNMLSGAGPATASPLSVSTFSTDPLACLSLSASPATVPGISGAYLDATHILNV